MFFSGSQFKKPPEAKKQRAEFPKESGE